MNASVTFCPERADVSKNFMSSGRGRAREGAVGAGGQGWQCLAGVRRASKRRRGAHSLASCSPWALVTCRMDVMSHLRLRLARSEKRHARHTHTRLRPAAAQRRPQPAACRAMRLNVRAHLLPMRILFTVCGALASMLRTQLRILLHVFVLVTSCAGWLAGLGCSTRVDITRAASRFEWAGARK